MRILSIKIVALRNNEHFQFVTDTATLLKTLPKAVSDKFQNQITAFAAAIADEDAAIKKIMKSVLTAQIAEADAARDAVYRGLVDAVKSLKNHFKDEIRTIAVRTGNTIDAYDNVAKMGDVEETSALYNLLQDLENKHAEDVISLGLPDWVKELKKLNKAVETLLMSRNVESGENTTEAMRPVRRRTDEAYRNVTVCLEAFSMVDTAENIAEIEKMITSLNSVIEQYNNLIAQRRGRAAAKKEDETENTTEE